MHRFEYFNHKFNETSLNRNCKLSYSWSAKGQTIKYKNIVFKVSLSIMLAITSKGNWFAGYKKNY